MRYKIQFDLASSLVTKGEAPTAGVGGTEACAARTKLERPAVTPFCGSRCPLNSPNRRIRTRTYGGVGGEEPRGSPLSRCVPSMIDSLEV